MKEIKIVTILTIVLVLFSCTNSSKTNTNANTDEKKIQNINSVITVDTINTIQLNKILITEDTTKKINYLNKLDKNLKKDSLYIGMYLVNYGNIFLSKQMKNWMFTTTNLSNTVVFKYHHEPFQKTLDIGKFLLTNNNSSSTYTQASTKINFNSALYQFSNNDKYTLYIFYLTNDKNSTLQDQENYKISTQSNSITTGDYYSIN